MVGGTLRHVETKVGGGRDSEACGDQRWVVGGTLRHVETKVGTLRHVETKVGGGRDSEACGDQGGWWEGQ